jgi:amino acid transporter
VTQLIDRPKRALLGRPLAAHELGETLVSKRLALPIFATDALSSVAYATEAALLVLIGATYASRDAVIPIAIAVAALLVIVVLSYQQTVRAYPSSGGAYVVARENLGDLAALVAGAALLVDYVLTVAVSVSAGIVAITSIAPGLAPHATSLAIACVVLLTVVNLRGVRESGIAFALPTYLFIVSMFALIGTGLTRCAVHGCPTADVPHPVAAGTASLGVFLILRAFASGASALTGVEAIANGVSAFRPPQARNAARTLGVLAVLAVTFFLGVSILAVGTGAAPSESASVLSQIARAVFPAGSAAGVLYYVVQAATLAVLVLAANTSYQGFPRQLALLAQDRFAPRQFRNLGDRLVYSNGIVVLAGLAIALLWGFHADTDALIHLYVVGVFTAFTLSQAGMVRRARRLRRPGWKRSAALTGFGAVMTGLVLAIVIATKFSEGAWAVIVIVPVIVLFSYAVRGHYRRVARRLRAGVTAVQAAPAADNKVLLYVERLDDATRRAARYAAQISDGRYTPVAVPDDQHPLDFAPEWDAFTGGAVDLEILPRQGSRAETVLERLWCMPRGESQFVTVVIPEQFERRSWLAEVRQGTELALKVRLLDESGVAIADVTETGNGAPPRARTVCRVLVPDAHAASIRALRYADTLGIGDTRAMFFAADKREAVKVRRDWLHHRLKVPLDIIDAPYRDLGRPLLRELRGLTADGDTTVVVVMPELRVGGVARLLHNQTALYLKRLLLFEPGVVLTSVPFQLD